jgi:hypothetical protein
MNVVKIRQNLEVRGCDAEDLASRVDELRRSIRRRNGTILSVKWSGGSCRTTHAAWILCQLPMGNAELLSNGA